MEHFTKLQKFGKAERSGAQVEDPGLDYFVTWDNWREGYCLMIKLEGRGQ